MYKLQNCKKLTQVKKNALYLPWKHKIFDFLRKDNCCLNDLNKMVLSTTFS